jgi:hypothetical protein
VKIELVYALRERQIWLELDLAAGATVAAAVEQSGLRAEFPEISLQGTPMGIHGRVVAPETVLREGDRVEIYRPLRVEPKEARRKRLRKG